MLKIGIIDSGIADLSYPQILKKCSFKWTDDGIATVEDKVMDQLGHGSVLANIIRRQSPDAKIVVAKVFFHKLLCTPAQIAAALDWQIGQGAVLINMSFGLLADRSVLREACLRAAEAGVILVAASPARGKDIYPASYPGVIRATGDARCCSGEISYLNSTQADFGGFVRADNARIAGASVGCAYVTSAFANILIKHPNLGRPELIVSLINQANYIGLEHRTVA